MHSTRKLFEHTNGNEMKIPLGTSWNSWEIPLGTDFWNFTKYPAVVNFLKSVPSGIFHLFQEVPSGIFISFAFVWSYNFLNQSIWDYRLFLVSLQIVYCRKDLNSKFWLLENNPKIPLGTLYNWSKIPLGTNFVQSGIANFCCTQR